MFVSKSNFRFCLQYLTDYPNFSYDTIRYDSRVLTWTQKLSIQLSISDWQLMTVARQVKVHFVTEF